MYETILTGHPYPWFYEPNPDQMKQSRTTALSALFFMLLTITLIPATPFGEAEARQSTISLSGQGVRAEISPRVPANEAIRSITDREGDVEMLLTDVAINIQFTTDFIDETTGDMKRELRSDSEAGVIAAILGVVTDGVGSLMNRSLAIPLSDISEVDYSDERIIITAVDGSELFQNVSIRNGDLMESFPSRDARRFTRDAQRALN